MQTGAISGVGGITKGGNYTVSMSAVETYQGGTTINAGVLRVSGAGSINNTSGININGGEFGYTSSKTLTAGITFTSGILSGTGTVSPVLATSNNAIIAPGATSAAGTYGVLTVNGNVSLKDAGSNGANDGGKLAIGVSKAALGGPVGTAGVTYDQLQVMSTASSVDLTKGVLALSLGPNVEAGDVYYILNNQISSGGLVGTFGSATINGAAASESTTNIGGVNYQTFSTGIYNFAVSYGAVAGTSFGGSGNDVALQVVAAPEPTSLGFVAAGGLILLGRRRRTRGIISN
jgi:autotransporter-associated beta strand protein